MKPTTYMSAAAQSKYIKRNRYFIRFFEVQREQKERAYLSWIIFCQLNRLPNLEVTPLILFRPHFKRLITCPISDWSTPMVKAWCAWYGRSLIICLFLQEFSKEVSLYVIWNAQCTYCIFICGAEWALYIDRELALAPWLVHHYQKLHTCFGPTNTGY